MFSHVPSGNDRIELGKPIDTKAKNILFITSTRIGDAVLATGILNHLIKEHKNAKITIACGQVAAPLFGAVPNLERIIVIKKRKFSWHWFLLWREVAFRKWDIVVDLRRSLLPFFICAKKRHQLKKSKEKVHRVVENAKVLGLEDKPPAPFIWVAPEHRNGAIKRMYNMPKVLAVAPAANWRAKTWRGENFAELVKRITAEDGFLPNAGVAVFGAESEREQARPLLNSIHKDRLIDFVGGVSLLSACACLERCDFFIGNDSGLMHMASTLGLLTLGLFGPTDERLYAPWGDRAAVVRTAVPFDKIFPENFNHRTSDTLMDSLTVDMAEDAAWALWSKYHILPVRKKRENSNG